MSNISTYSVTAANNNSASPNGFPEGMAAAGVNNSAREVMAAIRRWYEEAEWVDLGNTPTYATSTTFTIAGNVTSTYHVRRRLRLTDSSTLYGVITASSYSAPNTTITVALDSGSLSGSLTAVAMAAQSAVNPSIPVLDEDTMTSNSALLPPSQQSAKAYIDSAITTELGALYTDYSSSNIAIGSAVSLVTGTEKTITSISLAAGTWDVSINGGFTGGASTQVTQLGVSVSTTNNTGDYTVGRGSVIVLPASFAPFASNQYNVHVPAVRLTLGATTTVYFVAYATFSVSTCSAFGIITARSVPQE